MNGTVQSQIFQINFVEGVAQPAVAIGTPIETGISCGKQTVGVETCDGTETVEVDQEVAIRGIVHTKPCPCPDEPHIGLITDLSMLDGPPVEDDTPQNSSDPDFIVQGSGDQNLPPSGINVPLFVGYQNNCLLYTSPSPRDATLSRMPSSA